MPPAASMSAPAWLAAPDDASIAGHLRRDGYALLAPACVAGLAPCAPADLHRLAGHWDDLPPDDHLKDGGRYRRRRHGSFVHDVAADTLQAVPHRAHWQPTTYNALHGGMLRWFAPLAPALAQAPALRGLVRGLGRCFAQAAQAAQTTQGAQGAQAAPGEPVFDGRWFVEAHAFRIDTTGGMGRPTPEGAHRDGVAFVAVVLLGRQGIVGGETRVFQADGPQGVRFTLDAPWSALLLDDARVIHESTPIQPVMQPVTPPVVAPGHRDTLVLTYRAHGFQDPPSPDDR